MSVEFLEEKGEGKNKYMKKNGQKSYKFDEYYKPENLNEPQAEEAWKLHQSTSQSIYIKPLKKKKEQSLIRLRKKKVL